MISMDCLKSREFTNLLGMEISWFIENETITIAENIGREPAIQAETTGTDLLVLMTIGIARRLNDYGITLNRLYLLTLNIWYMSIYTRFYGFCRLTA